MSKAKISAAATKELLRLAKEQAGLLTPAHVVEAAQPSTSPLHALFEWNDGDAAHQWRLHQARNMLRVCVKHMRVSGKRRMVKAFVSLTPDRKDPDGGYRVLSTVLRRDQQRAQLLTDALAEMLVFQEKYAMLSELAGVFEAMAAARKQV